jgi:hypothetical protein
MLTPLSVTCYIAAAAVIVIVVFGAAAAAVAPADMWSASLIAPRAP